MDEVTAITPLTDIVRVMCVFYSMSRILMKPEDSQMLLGLLLRLLDHANKSVRDAAQNGFVLYLDTLSEKDKESILHQFTKTLSARAGLDPVKEEKAVGDCACA